MNTKIAAFLRIHAPATPCLVLDVDTVEANYRKLLSALPAARIYYAVKANPAAPILDRLAGLGSSFDAASWEEIEACLAAGAAPDSISFGNTVKKESAIKAAFAAGVTMFAFDSEPELKKLARSAPGARVYCRILVENKGAEWPLSRKFGCEAKMARDLMLKAAEWGLDPYGISFHVGSQQTRTDAYQAAIGQAAMIFSDLRDAGVTLRMVNLGGGYPVRYRAEVPGIDDFGAAIMGAMAQHFGNALPEIVIEPGRFMVGVFRGREPLYLDCYEGGAFRTRAEVQLLLLDNQLPADEAFLRPVTTRQTLARCARNLVSQFEAQGDDRSSRLFLTFVHALEQSDERA